MGKLPLERCFRVYDRLTRLILTAHDARCLCWVSLKVMLENSSHYVELEVTLKVKQKIKMGC